MSDVPPGWTPSDASGTGHPPPGPVPGYGAVPPGVGAHVPPWGVPVHKPGVVALRPLRLGDLYDGAFQTIRRNPKAMVGLAAAVTALFMVVPVLLTAALAAAGQLRLDPLADEASVVVARLLGPLAGGVFGWLAGVVLNGMLVHVVAQAVLGRRTSIGQAWAAVRGRLPRLFGLALLDLALSVLVLAVPAVLGVLVGYAVGVGAGFAIGVPLLLVGVAALVFVQVRFFQLAAPALVLERVGVLEALRRGGRLSRHQWWRLFGIMLLTALVVGVAGQVLAIPIGLVGGVGSVALSGTAAGLVLVFSSYVSQIVVGTLTTPFSSAVVALQYVDQRIRKEGLDVQLIAASQGPAPEMR